MVIYQVFLSNTNNLHLVVQIQVFLSNTDNLYSYMVSKNYSYLIIKIISLHKVICFQVLLPNTNNLLVHWHNGQRVHQWSRRPVFNPWSNHTHT